LAGFIAVAFLLAVLVTGFLETFVAGAFVAGAFWATRLIGAFVADVFFKTSVTVVTAAPTAVLTAPATSSAIAIPKPTASPAFSTIVFSAILGFLSFCVDMQLQIVEVY
jgi:hypothetical protein